MPGILVPFILYTSKKGKIKNINKLARDILNFEITWTILLFFIPFLLFLLSKIGALESLSLKMIFTVTGLMYLINLLYILFNILRNYNDKDVMYYPQIKFLR